MCMTVCIHVPLVSVWGWEVGMCLYKYSPHVGYVQLQQYGFCARLIFPSYFRLFLLRASLDQSKTSTKQKTKKPSAPAKSEYLPFLCLISCYRTPLRSYSKKTTSTDW